MEAQEEGSEAGEAAEGESAEADQAEGNGPNENVSETATEKSTVGE